MKPQTTIGIVLHGVATMIYSLDPELKGFFWIPLTFFIINIVGVILYYSVDKKTGLKTILYSSFPLVPLGLIAIFGARKELNEINMEEIEQTHRNI